MRVKFFKVDFNNPRYGIEYYTNQINDFCKSIEDNGGKILNIDSKTIVERQLAITVVYKEEKE